MIFSKSPDPEPQQCESCTAVGLASVTGRQFPSSSGWQVTVGEDGLTVWKEERTLSTVFRRRSAPDKTHHPTGRAQLRGLWGSQRPRAPVSPSRNCDICDAAVGHSLQGSTDQALGVQGRGWPDVLGPHAGGHREGVSLLIPGTGDEVDQEQHGAPVSCSSLS